MAANNYARCVRIMHPLSEVRLYRLLSAFFRMVGIFACENIHGRKYGDETDWEYEIEPGLEESEESLEQGFYNILEEMKRSFDEEAIEVLKKIAAVFLKYDLMRASYAQDYFGDAEIEYEFIYRQVESARVRFEEALKSYEEMEEQCEECNGNIYIWAAKSSCKRRINELYTIIWNAIQNGRYGKDEDEREALKEELWKSHYYSLDEVNGDILKILDKEPWFYGAYTIRGFMLEVDDEYNIESVKDIKNAISIIGEKSYISYLYYRIGRYCERVRHNIPVKIEYYKKAWEVDSNNYRALCKLAEYEGEQKNYEESANLWERVLCILEERRELPSLQPVECAYLYRAYRELGYLSVRQENFLHGIDFLKKAEAVYDNQINEDLHQGFYPWMFGEEEVEWHEGTVKRWEIYKSAARDKLRIEDTYRDMVKAAARTNNQELYNEYKEKLENLQK
ncbi:hypothetical protein IMSAGC020_01316 [Lachnospiraceae bacterium]|nr:hypothetical protein IMSAGC020_01316 [Lachnospiraceae bacterium]